MTPNSFKTYRARPGDWVHVPNKVRWQSHGKIYDMPQPKRGFLAWLRGR